MQQNDKGIIYEISWKDILKFGQVELIKLSDSMRLQEKRYLKLNEEQKTVILFDENKIPKKQFDYRYQTKDTKSQSFSYAYITIYDEKDENKNMSKGQAQRHKNMKNYIKVDFQKEFSLISPTESAKTKLKVFILNLHLEFPKFCLEKFTKNQLEKIYPDDKEMMKWDFFSYCTKKETSIPPNPIPPNPLPPNPLPPNPKAELQNLLEQALNRKPKEKWTVPVIFQIEREQYEKQLEFSQCWGAMSQSSLGIQYSKIVGSHSQSDFDIGNIFLTVNIEQGHIKQNGKQILNFFQIEY